MQDRLAQLGLDPSNSIVIGSGILGALGIRKSGDIDLVVTPEAYAKIQAPGTFQQALNHGREVLIKDDIDVGTNWIVLAHNNTFTDLFPNSIVIAGIRYITLKFLYKVKLSWLHDADVRQKDFDDVKLIEKYLNK